jgi:hypothetical protein
VLRAWLKGVGGKLGGVGDRAGLGAGRVFQARFSRRLIRSPCRRRRRTNRGSWRLFLPATAWSANCRHRARRRSAPAKGLQSRPSHGKSRKTVRAQWTSLRLHHVAALRVTTRWRLRRMRTPLWRRWFWDSCLRIYAVPCAVGIGCRADSRIGNPALGAP